MSQQYASTRPYTYM